MPKRKNVRARRKLFKKKNTLAKDVKLIKATLKSTMKSYTDSVNVAPSTTPVVVAISDIAQGDDYNLRDGRSIMAKSLQIQGNIEVAASSVITIVRLVLFIDNDNYGTAPTSSNIGISDTYILRDGSPQNLKRFKVLMDKVYRLDVTSNLSKSVTYYKKMNHTIKFDGVNATDYSQGSIWLLYVSNQATYVPALNLSTRLRFTD